MISLILITSVEAMELPKPPNDFSWKEIIEIKAAFLVPDRWHFKREAKDNTLAFFITQQDIDKEGRFDTGVTINVFRKAKPGTAVEYAKSFIARIATDKKAGDIWARQFGPFQSFGCRFKGANSPHIPIIHMLMVANPKTGTLYLFIFEAPEATWT
ncbi:MAG: hypothetical protein KGL32_07630, partial [candidate division NC10 bacterium]|nr:hypothetical protein [candidate division NC10 bacterium]